jgi:hydroxypyruvate isomerase
MPKPEFRDAESSREDCGGGRSRGFIFGQPEALGYHGWIGLEYNPTTATTEESLGWMA